MYKWTSLIDAAIWDDRCLIHTDHKGFNVMEKYLRIPDSKRKITIRLEFFGYSNRSIKIKIRCPYIFEFIADCNLVDENAVGEFAVYSDSGYKGDFKKIEKRLEKSSFKLLGKTTQEDFEAFMVYLSMRLGL